MKPLEEVWSQQKREAFRDEVFARKKGWYSPALHLAVPSTFGLGVMISAVFFMHDVKVWELLFGLGLFVLANATEWRIHKSLLHHRAPFAPFLYDRHTPEHHMVFVTEDMAIRSRNEFRLVLLPSFAVVLLGVLLSPIAAALWFVAGQHNLACIFALVTMGYVVSYEWLHLSYHLPESSFIGRRALIRALRRHHALHHDPRLMQRWNFNVSLPLWDLVRRTSVRSAEEARVMPRARFQP